MKLKALSQVALIASPFRILCATKNLLKVSHRLWTAEAGSLRPTCLRFTEVSIFGDRPVTGIRAQALRETFWTHFHTDTFESAMPTPASSAHTYPNRNPDARRPGPS